MKKLMLAIAATTAFVSVASAEDAWFTGTIGSEDGGVWTMTPGSGSISTNSTTLVLDEATSASFAATTQKSLSSSENLNFATSAKFAYSYDTLPAVDQSAKAGVVVYTNEYYVLAKKESANDWAPTGIAVDNIEDNVDVSVTISNGNNAVYAIYNIGGTSITKEVVADDSAWGTVDYKGSGEVASLVGTTISLGYPIPSGDPIPTDVGNAWATKYGIDQTKLAELLASDTKYNGRTVAESCLLGVGTNDNFVATIADTVATKLSFAIVCTPTIADRVKFALKKDGVAGEKQTATAFTPDVAAGIYQIVAYVDDVEVPASQEIGVKGTEVAASKVYFIGATYADCAIADLFKKTCCAEGDMVEIYDAESDSYKSWRFNGTAWEFAVGQGVAPASIKKGQAVKYTTAAAGTLYQVGDISEIVETAIVPGGDSGAKWNLVASPRAPIQVAALPLDSTKARALVLGGEDGITAQKIYLKVGGVLYVKSGWDANPVKVEDTPVMEGAFFLKTKDAVKIEWPAAAAK